MKWLLPALFLASLATHCKNDDKSVANLYTFRGGAATAGVTHDLHVHLDLAFKLDDTAGPMLDIANKHFFLNAFALDANGAQLDLGRGTEIPAKDLAVTFTGTHDAFDAVVRVPSTVQQRAGGYALRFELRETTAAFLLRHRLTETSDTGLTALRGGIGTDTAAASNQVVMNVATTIAAQIASGSFTDTGTAPNLTAYNDVALLLTEKLRTVEGTTAAGSQSVTVYTAALAAALKLQVITDQTLQGHIVQKLGVATAAVANEADKIAATEKQASGFTQTLVNFQTSVQTRFASGATAEWKVFAMNAIDQAKIEDPLATTPSVYAPKSVAFADTDHAATMGGDVMLTAAEQTTGIGAYNVYLGGNDARASRTQLVGKLQSAATPLKLTVAAGTAVADGATRIWVYPVTTGQKELDLPAWSVFANDTSSVQTTSLALNAVAGAPGPFTVTAATREPAKVSVYWTNSANAASYTIARGTVEGSYPESLGSAGSSPFIDNSAQDATTYFYMVTAVNAGGTTAATAAVKTMRYAGHPGGTRRLAGGNGNFLFVTLDKTLACWGSNQATRCGESTGSQPVYLTTPREGANGTERSLFRDVMQVASSGPGSGAVTTSGEFWRWGSFVIGDPAYGTTPNHIEFPYRATLKDGTAMANVRQAETLAGSTWIALLNDGSLVAWGGNDRGQLGDGTLTDRADPVPVSTAYQTPLTDIVSIACAFQHCYGLKDNGTLWTWGSGIAFATLVEGLAGVQDFGAGYTPQGIAVKSDGSVWTWGEAGRNTAPARIYKQKGVYFADAKQVVAGESSAYLVDAAGQVWAWGANDSGQRGNGSTANPACRGPFIGPCFPNLVTKADGTPLTGIVAIKTYATSVVALDASDNLWTWGNNANGEAGNSEAPDPARSAYPVTLSF